MMAEDKTDRQTDRYCHRLKPRSHNSVYVRWGLEKMPKSAARNCTVWLHNLGFFGHYFKITENLQWLLACKNTNTLTCCNLQSDCTLTKFGFQP